MSSSAKHEKQAEELVGGGQQEQEQEAASVHNRARRGSGSGDAIYEQPLVSEEETKATALELTTLRRDTGRAHRLSRLSRPGALAVRGIGSSTNNSDTNPDDINAGTGERLGANANEQPLVPNQDQRIIHVHAVLSPTEQQQQQQQDQEARPSSSHTDLESFELVEATRVWDKELSTPDACACFSEWNWKTKLVISILVSIVILMALRFAESFSSASSLKSDTSTSPVDWTEETGRDVTGGIEPISLSRLEQIKQKGYLTCQYHQNSSQALSREQDDGTRLGMLPSMCTAISAAILGPDNAKVEYVDMNEGDTFDIQPVEVTPFMDTRQKNIRSAATFYRGGFVLAGDPFYLECAEDKHFKYIEECKDLMFCAREDSQRYDFILGDLSQRNVIVIEGGPMDYFRAIADGVCNIFTVLPIAMGEAGLRKMGYTGDYTTGSKIYSKAMWSLMTPADDPVLSDFVNALFGALLVAELRNITRETAEQFPQTQVFGDGYQDMFRHAVAAVGNYGEMYESSVEPFQPRENQNFLYNEGAKEHVMNATGLMYTMPIDQIYDGTDVDGNGPKPLGGTLRKVLERGRLHCGVRFGRPGFAMEAAPNSTSASVTGLDVDFCFAVASGLFGGDLSTVDLVHLANSGEGYRMLVSGDVDIVAGATWNLENDVREPTTGIGFSFSEPYFYRPTIPSSSGNELGTEENLCLATMQDDHDWASFVYWVSSSTVYAEEMGIDKRLFNRMPLSNAYGPGLKRMFKDTVLGVGNYQEIYRRNLEETGILPRSGQNLLNGAVRFGPQFYAMPGLIP